MTRYESVPEPSETRYYPDDEIDLREVFGILWRGKWVIVATTVLFAVTGVVYALSKSNVYEATALLAPVQNEGSVGIGGQLSGLASLAGLSFGGGETNRTAIAKEVLQSRAFLSSFIRRHELSVPLMAVSKWNFEERAWEYNQLVYDAASGEWETGETGESLKPSDWDLVKAFRGQLSINENKDNGMITLAVSSLSPVAAAEWAELLVNDINEHMRSQDVEEAEASIAYLEDKLNETNIAGMQQVFYQLIESETRTVMLANAQREYVFQTVDPAVVPQEKSGPKRALIAATATILGGMLGVFIVFVVAFIRTGREETKTL
ncbi:MAG: LPS O-antigen length regulator [Leeuwenhoekiella sp.]|nr:MAG: LPS O-antigen length regulator [Leeuwenhoekiella sp.]